MASKQPQLQFFKKGTDRYGGSLLTSRKGRAHGRPFSRIVRGFKANLNLRDYIAINKLEGFGYGRSDAAYIVNSTTLADTG